MVHPVAEVMVDYRNGTQRSYRGKGSSPTPLIGNRHHCPAARQVPAIGDHLIDVHGRENYDGQQGKDDSLAQAH